MSAPSLPEPLALVAADPALADHPVTAMEAELTALREQVADLQRQLGRHSGNRGQPGHAGRTRLQSEPIDDHRDHWPTRCGGCGAVLPRIDAGAPACR